MWKKNIGLSKWEVSIPILRLAQNGNKQVMKTVLSKELIAFCTIKLRLLDDQMTLDILLARS